MGMPAAASRQLPLRPAVGAGVRRGSSVGSRCRGAAEIGRGFTHLLINWGEVGRLGGPDFRVLRWETPDAGARWRELLSGFTTPLFREGAIEVRALLGGQP